jgi:hypothetical protein
MVIFSAMLNSSNKFMPGRLFLPGCAIAAGVLSLSAQAFAQSPTQSGAKKSVQDKPFATPIQLRIGSTASFPLANNAKFIVEEGVLNITADTRNEALTLKGVMEGVVRVRIQTPGKADAVYQLSVYDKSKAAPKQLANNSTILKSPITTEQFITRRAALQVSERGALLPPDSNG